MIEAIRSLGGSVESASASSCVVLGRLQIRRGKPDAAVELSPEATAALDLVRRLRAAGRCMVAARRGS